MTVSNLGHWRAGLLALRDPESASRREQAAWQPVRVFRGNPGNSDEVLRTPVVWHARDQPCGVGVAGPADDGPEFCLLEYLAAIHHGDAVGYRRNGS